MNKSLYAAPIKICISTAIPPTSTSDIMGQHNKIRDIAFTAALVFKKAACMLGNYKEFHLQLGAYRLGSTRQTRVSEKVTWWPTGHQWDADGKEANKDLGCNKCKWETFSTKSHLQQHLLFWLPLLRKSQTTKCRKSCSGQHWACLRKTS